MHQPTKLIIANLKMNQTLAIAEQYLGDLRAPLNKILSAAHPPMVGFAPQSPLLPLFLHQIKTNHPSALVGAQNLSTEAQGAFTGEVSAQLLASLGTHFAILGHSEQRKYFAANNGAGELKRKLQHCLQQKLLPIFCVGETLEQRQRGETEAVIAEQLLPITELRSEINDIKHPTLPALVIAYEPVWSIGTGLTANPEQILQVHRFLRNQLNAHFPEKAAGANGQGGKILIIYGGSANETNAKEILGLDQVDGLLVGGASLKPTTWVTLLEQALNFHP